MSSRSRSFAAHAALVAILAAPALGAQQPASQLMSLDAGATARPAATVAASLLDAPRVTPADSVRPITGGAPLAGAGVAVRAPARSHATAPTVAAPAGSLRQSQVLMVVGAAAVVVGLVAGGDAEAPLVVGGAIIGLFGLYQYLR